MTVVNFRLLFILKVLNIFQGKFRDIFYWHDGKNGEKNNIIKKMCGLQKANFMEKY